MWDKNYFLKINQKALTNQGPLTRWVVDLNHTRKSEQSGFQSVTRPSGFTHPHRVPSLVNGVNKNNPRIASEVVFSSFMERDSLIENLIASIANLLYLCQGVIINNTPNTVNKFSK